MINIIELYNLKAKRYLNCYKEYIDNLDNRISLELKYTLFHRMHIYYEILEIIYDSINE